MTCVRIDFLVGLPYWKILLILPFYGKKVQTMFINNSTNINKANIHISSWLVEKKKEDNSDGERFLLKNGPMAPSSKFQWAIQKINGHFINPMSHSLHAFFGFESCATDCHCIFLANFYKTFYFQLITARAKVFPIPVYIYGVQTLHFRFQ